MIRILVGFVALLCSASSLHAQDSCARSELQTAVDSYIATQRAGDVSKMALAPQVKYLENMSETAKEKGLWNTALPIAFHRSIYDVARCKTEPRRVFRRGYYLSHATIADPFHV